MAQRPITATEAKTNAAVQPLLEKIKIGTQLYNIHDPLVDVLATNIDSQVSYLIGEIDALATSKQDTLTIDSTVTPASTNAVESQGIYSYVGGALSEFDSTLTRVAHTGEYGDLLNTPTDHVTTSELASQLASYYTKTEVENYTYSKSETWNNIQDYAYSKVETQEKINEVLGDIAEINQFKYQVVESLPASPTADNMYTIYLVPASDGGSEPDYYVEYLLVNKGTTNDPNYAWEMLGTTDVAISGFVTEGALHNVLSSYVTSSNLADQLASYYTKAEIDAATYVSHSELGAELTSYATLAYTAAELAKKQNVLTIDSTVTEGGANVVTGGAIYSYVAGALATVDGVAVKTINGVSPTNGAITLTKETISYSKVTAIEGQYLDNSGTTAHVMVVTDNTFTAVTKVNGESV